MEKNFDKFCETYSLLRSKNIDFCVITMVDGKGSTPQDTGSRMIVSLDDLLFGTIGGGKIESHCINTARVLLNSIHNEDKKLFKWNLQRDIGMTCGGEVSMFFEVHRSVHKWNIVIFGAGHVSQELTRTLSRIECEITVIDHRSEWLDKLEDNIHKVKLETPKDYVAKLNNNDFVVLMTMGHSTDLPILSEILKHKKLAYLGVIGSISKRNVIEKELLEDGIDSKDFICPIGLDIGSNSPSEIAISITAQLLKCRDKL
jgi:xanthine dehydrogenase accessory factor